MLCGPSGLIDRFVRDDLGLPPAPAAHNFKDLLDDSSRAKSQAFFEAMRESGLAFGWELNVVVQDAPVTLHFVGGLAGDQYLVCGVLSEDKLLGFLEEITEIDSEQACQFRFTARQLLAVRTQQLSSYQLYDELSRLNNELVNTQRELHKSNQRLRQINEEKNRAIGIVAHDLRNPISIIQMYSTYLLQVAGGRLDAEEREGLDTMLQTAKSMSQLVNSILDTAAIEAGKLQLRLAAIDASEFLQGIVKRMRPIARESQVDLALDVAPNFQQSFQGDATKLEQVFCNLIDNAVKYSPSGEVVRVTAAPNGKMLDICVADRGPGIAAEILAGLFRPFTTGPQGRGRAGTGLGLSIAKNIVTGHGGAIKVDSAPDRGTRFTVSLPC